MRKTRDLRAELLKQFHNKGYTLRETMHPMRLGYHPSTLAKLARTHGVYFSDLDEVEKEGREASRLARR